MCTQFLVPCSNVGGQPCDYDYTHHKILTLMFMFITKVGSDSFKGLFLRKCAQRIVCVPVQQVQYDMAWHVNHCRCVSK